MYIHKKIKRTHNAKWELTQPQPNPQAINWLNSHTYRVALSKTTYKS